MMKKPPQTEAAYEKDHTNHVVKQATKVDIAHVREIAAWIALSLLSGVLIGAFGVMNILNIQSDTLLKQVSQTAIAGTLLKATK